MLYLGKKKQTSEEKTEAPIASFRDNRLILNLHALFITLSLRISKTDITLYIKPL
jgi:hypothetical protein